MASADPERTGCHPVGRGPGCRNRADPSPASVRDEPDPGRGAASAPTASATTSSVSAAVRYEPGTGWPGPAGGAPIGYEPVSGAEPCTTGHTSFGDNTAGTGAECGSIGPG